jgi:hypothetical protein
MDHQEEQFTRGFNSGYLLAKYLPELKSKISKGLNDESSYIKGFLLGAKECEVQKMNELKRVRTQSKGKQRGIER